MSKHPGLWSENDVLTTEDTWNASGNTAGAKPEAAGGGGGKGLLTTYTSGDPATANGDEFNVQVNFDGHWTAKQQAVVTWAADFFSQIITADIRDDTDLNGALVDDVVLTMSTGRIDGKGNPLTGNTLAQTGNLVVRDDNTVNEWLTLTASINLDSTDLKNDSLSGTWDAIVAHEMAHALGFVSPIFSFLGLLDGTTGAFNGTNAVAAYGGQVPLENAGGVVGSHWDELTFAPNGESMSNELMTGFFVPGEQTLLSDTTIGALQDLGYTVADPDPTQNSFVVDSGLLVV